MESSTRAEMIDHIRKFSVPPAYLMYKPAVQFVALCIFVAMGVVLPGVWKVVGVVCAASQFIALYALLHGASHYHLSANRRLNDRLGIFLAMVLGTSFHAYRVVHLRHHGRLRKPDDPQDVIHTAPNNRFVTALLLVTASLIGAALFVWIRVPFLGAKYGSPRRVLLEMCLPVAFYALVIYVFVAVLPPGSSHVLIATVITAIVWGSLIDITYHQGLPTSGDAECSRSLNCDGFGFWVLNGENRHAEHHAFPNVPLPNWRKLVPIVRPVLEKEGAVYERGYVSALTKCVLQCPLFLPPHEKQPE